MIGRLVHSRDFERMRGASTWSRSAHFAVHHLPGWPERAPRAGTGPVTSELSTTPVRISPPPVDDFPGGRWLGTVLPKRLARRAVTRNLLRRLIRAAMCRHALRLPSGLWVVRLRASFKRDEFVSAASCRLRQAARVELDGLLGRPSR